jgi:choline dehydrogenase
MVSVNGFDYIIVGGGSSGCVTAAKLVTEHGARVALIEQGPSNRHPLLRMPAGFVKMLKGSKYLTFHKTEPQPQLDGRVHDLPQGRVLGGGSTVNAMVYMRGRRSDYDAWNQATQAGPNGVGWGWDDILPHYRRQEGNQSLAGPAHGVDGPLKVSNPRHVAEISNVFVKTLQEMGLPLRNDFNDGTQAGVGYMQTTIGGARRCGAVEAFIEPVAGNPKLTIMTDARVLRVIVEGSRAVGVEIAQGGQVKRLDAANEVILAAGAFGTPKILMLSGFGQADELRRHDIDVRADLAGVGENLMDHHEVPLVAATHEKLGYYGEDRGIRMLANGLQYVLFGSGPVSTNGCETCAFINPLDPSGEPMIQFYCVPTVYLDRDVMGVTPTDGVTLNSCLLQPQARGNVRLRSADPAALPMINSNYLGHEDDIRHEIAGLRFAREVLKSGPMAKVVKGEIFPGEAFRSDAELLAHCKRTVKTNYHPCGTARMGAEDDPFAVVTPDLRVKGAEGLRVFDVSMMPRITSGNTNAPAMAVADRGVDIMMGAL